ncbi:MULTISPECIES: HNH endonuclease signature motif containing protein [unclassified Oceanobacillus]|uniref:HNH endonuclease n=1 Tax=unclassified Oceanobacillus TaxID=2630292 RepID=UPI001BEB9257|nr:MULTISPECIES: HNH endonuclease signature motif containing protein [unclassified Oceanobacillus]MBT2600957.1 HNH endonuclease [Oceanobacillus sp. ISL-74]MBT2653592.1 HNH endonuclease [Oceanobacillus sp. ISL-73]
MNKPLRPCREINCNILTRETWCESHKKNAQETTRNYNRYNRDDNTEGLYHSGEWRRLRQLALIRDNYLCQRCLKNKKRSKAQVVHHIIEVKDDWSKRLELDNLESLCHRCHNQHHKTNS